MNENDVRRIVREEIRLALESMYAAAHGDHPDDASANADYRIRDAVDSALSYMTNRDAKAQPAPANPFAHPQRTVQEWALAIHGLMAQARADGCYFNSGGFQISRKGDDWRGVWEGDL